MGKTETIDYPRGLTFEKVWAMFQETDRRMKETDRQMKETDRKFQKTREEIRKQMKETDRKIGELGNRFGELAEHLVAPNIKEKFKALQYNFEHISLDHEISDAEGNCIAEIDIMLENGDTVMAVEVKAKPSQKDVDEHIKRMEILRSRADARNDKRKYQGAIAGAVMKDEVRRYAHKAGFFVIEQTGDTVKINIPKGFTPREW